VVWYGEAFKTIGWVRFGPVVCGVVWYGEVGSLKIRWVGAR
jgi:hypothetical protein